MRTYSSYFSKWFTHPDVYPFCSTYIHDDLLTTIDTSKKDLIDYLPLDCIKPLGFKINTSLIIYLSKNKNLIRTNTLKSKYDYLPFQVHNPYNLHYHEDPTQYIALYHHTLILPDKGFNFRNFPPHVAYTTTYKRSNRHYIRSIFTYEPFELTDYAILVKDLIEDDEW